MSENPKQRAQRRLAAWKAEMEDRYGRRSAEFTMKDLPVKVGLSPKKWRGSNLTHLFDKGPKLEHLDDVELMTGLSIHALIARPDDVAQDGPRDATERLLLKLFRGMPPATREAVLMLLNHPAAPDSTLVTAPTSAVAYDSSSSSVDLPAPKKRQRSRRSSA